MGESEARAARIWRVRERTEREAAELFAGLATDLATTRAPAELVDLAARCGRDELVHAEHCRRIVDALEPGLPPLAPVPTRTLGPAELGPADRALYTSVALGCVTESLSTALLIELRPHARHEAVRRGLDVIVRDEVRHSRLGWAHLARAAAHRDVRWLAPHVPGMLRAALASEEIAPALHGHTAPDLRAFGILGRAEVERICRATVATTILPGLHLHGVTATPSAPPAA